MTAGAILKGVVRARYTAAPKIVDGQMLMTVYDVGVYVLGWTVLVYSARRGLVAGTEVSVRDLGAGEFEMVE